MTKPVTIPNTFATATTAIPLSNLDADFSTVASAMNDANTYSNYAPDTGSANAYVVTLTGVSTAYSAGLRIQFKAGNANTTASTLNVNAQGAKNITYQDASAIASGTIAANSIVDVMYDGTQFLLMNDPAGGTGGDVVGPASATDNAIVRFDGATGKLVQNSVVTIADSTGDISGVGQLNATTVDATNVEVTNIKAKDGTAAATIADSTGVVSITANPVLSGGTANGVLYLDGSKVATSGSALTFDGTNLALTTTGALYKVPTAGGSIFDAGGNNGIYIQGTPTHFLAFYAQGSEAMRLNSTGLGIGTSSPSFKLDVNGGLSAVRTNGATGSQVTYSVNGTETAIAYVDATQHILGSSTAIPVIFRTQGTEKMRLDSSGNLGLGVTPSAHAPSAFGGPILQVSLAGLLGSTTDGILAHNTYYASGAYRYIASSTAATRFDQTAGAFRWLTAASGTAGNAISFTQAMTLTAEGNRALGTSTAVNYGGGFIADTLNGSSGAYSVYQKSGTSQGQLGVEGSEFRMQAIGASTVATFVTNGSERARITSGGDLLVGTTSSSEKLAVAGNIKVGDQSIATNFYASGANIGIGTNAQDALFLCHVFGSGLAYFGYDATNDRVIIATDNGSGANKIDFSVNAGTTTGANNISSATTAMRITAAGNVSIGGTANRATTVGTNALQIFNGTAPVGTLTNGISLYSSSGEAYVMDAAGNATLFSPHDAETNEWVFKSKHTPTGKVLKIDVEKLLRFVNDHFGLDAVHEFIES